MKLVWYHFVTDITVKCLLFLNVKVFRTDDIVLFHGNMMYFSINNFKKGEKVSPEEIFYSCCRNLFCRHATMLICKCRHTAVIRVIKILRQAVIGK